MAPYSGIFSGTTGTTVWARVRQTVTLVGRPTRVWALRGADASEIVVGQMEGSDRLVVFARPGADPKDYFRFRGGA